MTGLLVDVGVALNALLGVPVPRSSQSTGKHECVSSWKLVGFNYSWSQPLLEPSHCLLPFSFRKGTGMPMLLLLPPSWNGAASYIHWQGRLLDEASSKGLRRSQGEGGQVLRANVAAMRVAVAKVGCFCSGSGRGVARATLPGTDEALVRGESDRDAVAVEVRHDFWQSSTADL